MEIERKLRRVELKGRPHLLIDPYSVDAIAGAVLRLHSSPEPSASLTARGFERTNAFARATLSAYVRGAQPGA